MKKIGLVIIISFYTTLIVNGQVKSDYSNLEENQYYYSMLKESNNIIYVEDNFGNYSPKLNKYFVQWIVSGTKDFFQPYLSRELYQNIESSRDQSDIAYMYINEFIKVKIYPLSMLTNVYNENFNSVIYE